MDAARNAAGHQIGDTELAELLGIDPNDAPSDTDVEDYIVGVPILAEQARHADPAAWAWLTDVHETLGRLNAPPIWRTEITSGTSASSWPTLVGWSGSDLRERPGYPG